MLGCLPLLCDLHGTKNKNRQNLRKHDVRFETAVLVFDDPYAITHRDYTSRGEVRWITVGAIGPGCDAISCPYLL